MIFRKTGLNDFIWEMYCRISVLLNASLDHDCNYRNDKQRRNITIMCKYFAICLISLDVNLDNQKFMMFISKTPAS